MKKTIKKSVKITRPKYTISMVNAANDDDVVAKVVVANAEKNADFLSGAMAASCSR